MSPHWGAVAAVLLLVGVLLLLQWPLGTALARVMNSQRHLRVELVIYRLVGVAPQAEQTWQGYAVAVVAFSAAGIVLLFGLLSLQPYLPLSMGMGAVPPAGAFNTAVSFVSNTNWQWYSGESTLGYFVQAAGLTVQNFLSAAVGIAVAFAVMRGFVRSRSSVLGNFWVDIVRIVVRVLVPLSALAAVALIVGGVIQNLHDPITVTTVTGASQTLPGGPVATQEAIKLLGTNGGGFFNANSAHPWENPSTWTNTLQIVLMLAIPFSLPRAFGLVLGNRRQGMAILATMGVLWLTGVALTLWAELAANGAAPQLAGAAMEGKEVQFGPTLSAVFAASTTGTSSGAVNAMHDSFTAAGGGVAMVNMMLGEVAPGGVGSGLYGMLVLAITAVFLAGLMVGRTPELYGKRIGRQQISLVTLYLVTTPTLLLTGAALTTVIPALRSAAITQPGPHGLSDVLYAYASAANNNGSAFASFGAASTYQNLTLGVVMLLGRFVPMLLVLALAGTLAAQPVKDPGAGTLRTDTALFVGLLAVVVLFIAGLTYVPALALGPIAEALS